MARRRGGRGPGARRRRAWGGWLLLVLAAVAVAALPAYRAVWRRGESSLLRRGLEELHRSACTACHLRSGGWRWRADGGSPPSVEAIRDAVLRGRAAVPGFAPAMPAYAGRLPLRRWRAAVTAVAALEGLVGVPEDPELAAGHDVAMDAGCFGCHGLLGAGGVANPGSLPGEVPGWLGRSYRVRRTEVEAILRRGRRPVRVPVPGLRGPLLEMPGYGEVLDSTELELVTRYVEWLARHPPEAP